MSGTRSSRVTVIRERFWAIVAKVNGKSLDELPPPVPAWPRKLRANDAPEDAGLGSKEE